MQGIAEQAGLPRRRPLTILVLMLAVFLGCTASVRAQEAWLVTYGPGAEVWELFGHNALWLRDSASGLDHTYSFGYFEIDRPGFHLDFARGIMLYYGAGSPAEREFAFYRARQRSISAQRLNLSPAQVQELQGLIHAAIFPHPQFFQYDYFRRNCSTWLRDLLDQVLGGQLAQPLQAQAARLNFRDQTRRMTYPRPWIHTGIMLLMGPSIDQPISAWDESFLPDALARWLDSVAINGQPLVLETRILYDPGVFSVPEDARGPWRLMLAVGLLSAGLIVLSAWRGRGRWARVPWQLGVFAAGLAGSAMLLMWVASGHQDTWRNWMLLVLHPGWWLLFLHWPASWGRALRRVLWGALGLGALILSWPGWLQDRPDQLALVLPPLLAILLVSWPDLRSRVRQP
ncbi:MAG: lipoprotein N-acyltransferase Lnb domain-containing protein [Wenzhouxiangella sp.]